MDENKGERAETTIGDLVPFDKWLKSIGRGRVTGWNWRKSGAVKAINIFGRVYITRAEIARFEARAAGGEFVGNVQAAAALFPRRRKRKAVGFIDRLLGQKPKSKVEA
jgi:hypothetical protein